MSSVFSYCMPTRIIHGPGSLERAGNELKALGGKVALLVTDLGLVSAGLADRVRKNLERDGVRCHLFSGIKNTATLGAALAGSEEALRLDCDCVVPLGGGSALAVGKGVAVLATNGPDFYGLLKLPSLPQKPLPVMAIPTTAGSGSEVSQFIPLLDEKRKVKIALGGQQCFPPLAILDPELLVSVPYMQALYSGVDALTHALEAYWTTQATPITDALALGGLKLLAENLRTAATARTMEALDKCLLGSALANMACSNAKLGLVHHLNMFLSAYCPDISYGLGIGVLLPPVMAYNLQASIERFTHLAIALGEAPGKRSAREQAEGAVRAVRQLLADLGFPRRFTPQQLSPELIPSLAREAATAPCVNLRRANVADLEEILRQTLAGWEV